MLNLCIRLLHKVSVHWKNTGGEEFMQWAWNFYRSPDPILQNGPFLTCPLPSILLFSNSKERWLQIFGILVKKVSYSKSSQIDCRKSRPQNKQDFSPKEDWTFLMPVMALQPLVQAKVLYTSWGKESATETRTTRDDSQSNVLHCYQKTARYFVCREHTMEYIVPT